MEVILFAVRILDHVILTANLNYPYNLPVGATPNP